MSGTTPTPRPQKPVFAIFEGGGAKGIGHLGGLAAAERARLAFVGVAGASAGAIVAALVAVGYRAEQLFDPEEPNDNLLTRLGLTPTGLFGEARWAELKRMQSGLGWSLGGLVCAGALGALAAAFPTTRLLHRGYRGLGHFDTEPVRDFVNRALRSRLRKIYAERDLDEAALPERVRFADLDESRFSDDGVRHLKIIATDVDARRSVLFDRARTPEVEIGEAVAASAALPGVFQPALMPSYDGGRHRFADGGLVSNLPVHVFLEEKRAFERRNPERGRIPVVAFALVDPPGETERQAGAIGYVKAVARTAIFGGQAVARELVPDLVVLPLQVAIDTLQFDAGWDAIKGAYQDASRTGREAIARAPLLHGQQIRQELERVQQAVRKKLDAHETARGRPALAQSRAYILTPVGEHSLKVTHGIGMGEDTDDQLALDVESDGPARAWRRRHAATGTTLLQQSPMTKYERAMVRSSVQTWFAVPIFGRIEALKGPFRARPRPLGVLVVDTDARLGGAAWQVAREIPDTASLSVEFAAVIDWLEREAISLAASLDRS